MKRFRLLGFRGDTIVEVMIVLAVLGLAFSIASATANTSLQKSRNAQEHSEALGLINSQVELVRTAISKQTTLPTTDFCMTSTGAVDSSFGGTIPVTAASDKLVTSTPTSTAAPYPAACNKNTFYFLSVVYTPDPAAPTDDTKGYYDFKIRWDGVGSLGRQQEEITYRIHKLTADTTDPNLGNSASSVHVFVKAIKPPANGLPDCSVTAGATNLNAASMSVQLADITTGGSSAPQPIGSDSASHFDATVGHNYQASLSAPPSGFTVCPIVAGSDKSGVVQVGSDKNITMYIVSRAMYHTGKDFVTCVAGEPLSGGGHDGCNPYGALGGAFANALYSRRQIIATYALGGTAWPAGTADLVVNYSQLNGYGTTPPYAAFTLAVSFPPSASTQPMTLPIDQGSANSYNARNATQTISVPANATSITLFWNNNSGGDPDIQINSVQLYYKSN